MQQLEEKFQSELSSKATVVCCRFQLPNAKPVKTIEDGVDTVWVYENLKKSS